MKYEAVAATRPRRSLPNARTEDEGSREKAAMAHMGFFYPLPPLLEPLKRSRAYRIRRLGWNAEGEEVAGWLRALERGESILG